MLHDRLKKKIHLNHKHKLIMQTVKMIKEYPVGKLKAISKSAVGSKLSSLALEL